MITSDTYLGTTVHASPAALKAYRGTHCGDKSSKNLRPDKAAKPNEKAQAKLERRIKTFQNKEKTKHLHVRPGSLSTTKHGR